MKSVKISEETHRRLLKVTGLLQAKEGKRKTVEDAITFLLDRYEKSEES
ncbi:hypothetical protein KEJ18_07425 [Candidatus Bathyarchaeota archaeon]|nr:hypothetical protein [Candidatus Bathyarchaeota archaeon]